MDKIYLSHAERREIAVKLLAGFAANPALIGCTNEELVKYAITLTNKFLEDFNSAKYRVPQTDNIKNNELKKLIEYLENSTGTIAMEYQEYRNAVLKLCTISRNQAAIILRLQRVLPQTDAFQEKS